MMAFENTTKRSIQELITPIDPKKRKVEFAKDVTLYPISYNKEECNIKTSDELDGISSAIYARFVKSALDDLEKNDSTQINIIADQLSLDDNSTEKIKTDNLNILLDTLSSNINRVDSSKRTTLIQSLINLNRWWELPSVTLSKYVYFIRILCSSIPKWWQDVSMNLISNFSALSLKAANEHHILLNYFLSVIPSSLQLINSYLLKFFPNRNDTRKNLVNYISNILYLTKYCKELRFQVWSLIIEKIISIDVELQNELDEMDDDIESDFEEAEEEEEEDDDDDDDINSEDSEKDDDDDDNEELEGVEEYNVEVNQNIKELSTKLDVILTLVSENISSEVTPEGLENGEGVSVFNTLTTLFKTHILPTYYTRSIQYIMFHLSQQQLELMDSFLVTLIDISFAVNETSEKRIKSLQYLGSYIARAKRLSRTQIIFVASYLTSWLHRYVIEREEEVDQPGGMERFKHFYAAFQALCYIFCFRRDIFKDLDGNWECELDKFFQRMIISKFNPLKYCNENVMLMFARIAQHEDIAYCFSIIENNNNERLRGIAGKANSINKTSSTSFSNGTSASSAVWSLATRQQFIDLQSYFPFDPLFLKNYKEMMKDYYIEWSEVSGDLESDHESDE